MNIIIADDEYYARKALFSCISQAFNHAGFTDVNLLECEDAEQALVHLHEEKIDIVFTDIKMHKMSGIELCQIIHQDFPDTFSVIISGYADFIYAQKAIEYRVFKYLLKPIDEEDIENIISEFQLLKYKTTSADCLSSNAVNSHLPEQQDFILYANKLDSLTKKLILYYLDANKILLLEDHMNQYFKKKITANELVDENAYSYYNDVLKIIKEYIADTAYHQTLFATCDFLTMTSHPDLNSCTRFFKILLDDLNQQMVNITEQESTVSRFMDYIDEHYAEDLSLYKIAESVFYLHPNYLSKLLKNRTGMSFSKYITKIRMEKAAHMLLDTDLFISAIGSLVGYNSTSYFVQTFHKSYGLTPSEFRKQHEKEITDGM